MNDRRLTDDRLARVLGAHLPDRAQAGLHDRIAMVVESTAQRRALPSPFAALVDADPTARRRALLLAAALLVMLTVATAAAVGALLVWQRQAPIPQLSLDPPDDVDAYMQQSFDKLVDLPPLRIRLADGDVFYHDGAGTVRQERGAGTNGWVELFARTRTVHVEGAAPVWVVGPPNDVDPRIEMFRAGTCCDLDSTCATGWRYVGLEYVLDRPTHHVECGVERWMDVALGIPLRSHAENWDPSLLGPRDDEQEVVELEIGPQPAALFAENPDGLRVMTADEYTCSLDDACIPPPGVSRPSGGPPPASVQLEPHADLAAFIADVRASYGHLPELVMTVDSYSIPASPERRYRRFWNGVDGSRDESFHDGAWVVDWIHTGSIAYEQYGGFWHYYEGERVPDPLESAFELRLPSDCPQGWEHRGSDTVLDRPAYHLVCGLDQFWIDGEWLLVVRAQHDPGPLEPRTSIEEVIDLQFGPQPADLFTLPPGAKCSRCPSPTPEGPTAAP